MYGEELSLEEFLEEYTNDISDDESVELINLDSDKIVQLNKSEFGEIINERFD